MSSKAQSVIVFIVVFVIGAAAGGFVIWYFKLGSNNRPATNQPCVQVRSVSAPNPDAWAREPFTLQSIEYGIYRPERTQRTERDDTEL